MSALNSLQNKIRSGVVRAVGVNTTQNLKIHEALQKVGCAEFLLPPFSIRAINHKVSFWKTLIGKANKSSTELGLYGQGLKSTKGEYDLVMSIPIAARCDCWITVKKGDERWLMDRWFVPMIGPSPSIGKWEAVGTMRDLSKTQTWIWKVRKDKDHNFIQEDGLWKFKGAKPAFNWTSKCWEFVGAEPELFFEKTQGGPPVIRFRCESGNLILAENSEYGLALLPELLKTFGAEEYVVNEKTINGTNR